MGDKPTGEILFNRDKNYVRIGKGETQMIEKERETFMQKHNKFVLEETTRITKEQAGQKLRLQQWNEYVTKYQTVSKQIS